MGRRTLTAAVALPVLLFIVWQGDLWFAALVAVAAALGAWELCHMAESWGQKPLVAIAAALASVLAVTYYFIPSPKYPENMEGVAIFPALLAVSAAVVMLLAHRLRGPLSHILATVCIVLVIGGTLFHAPLLREFDTFSTNAGLLWVIFLLGVTMATDTAAYLVGKAIGSHKLAPNVSPNKTWEGAVGGFLGAVAVGVCLNSVMDLGAHTSVAVLGSAVLGITGQLGDLFESKVKRIAGVKDSGRLFPGHGGILDRMDSLMWNVVILYHMVALTTGSIA
ncbi:MAG: phosphatidate cytidylyltransferase [Dehalococcoidia bacterium]|nr:phosphatidate cytidylyltransferase [Dehalococcoidia bacterium]